MKAISKLESKRLEQEYIKHPMKIGHSWGITFPKDMAEVFNINDPKTKISLHPKPAENKIEIVLNKLKRYKMPLEGLILEIQKWV